MRALVVWAGLSAAALLGEDPESKARIRGVRDYARQGAAGIPQIAPYLEDSDPEVRWEAVKAIASIGGEASLDPLIKAAGDAEGEIQVRAVEGLVNVYLPGFLKTGFTSTFRKAGTSVKGRFTDTNTDIIDPAVQVPEKVVLALGKVARGGITMPARAMAARGAGILRGRAALPGLYEALKSTDDAVMYESLVAVQKIREPESGPRVQFLLKDLQPRVQIAAVEAAGLLRNRAALPDLRAIADGGGEMKVRRAALSAIAMMPEETSRPHYAKYFDHRDDGLRAAAAEGYGRLKNSSGLPALEKAYESEGKTQVKLSQAFALVLLGKRELGDPNPLQYLVTALNSRSYRDVAAPLLVELARDEETRAFLHTAVPRGTRDEKLRLAGVLGLSGGRDSLPVLQELQKDADAEVAQEALRAARNLEWRLQ